MKLLRIIFKQYLELLWRKNYTTVNKDQRFKGFNQTEQNRVQNCARISGSSGGSSHPLHRVLGREERVAVPPATLDRAEAGVAVILQQVLHQMLLHAKDQRAAVPLCAGGSETHDERPEQRHHANHEHTHLHTQQLLSQLLLKGAPAHPEALLTHRPPPPPALNKDNTAAHMLPRHGLAAPRSYPAPVVLHQVQFHRLNASVVAAGVDLRKTLRWKDFKVERL